MNVLLVTDPMCPWSWGFEPQMVRLRARAGEDLGLRIVMGGLAREVTAPERHALAWLDAGARSGQPVDPRMWLRDPPATSFPAALAVVAAAEQGRAQELLRRLRLGVALRGRRLDAMPALVDAAREVEGLDADRFRVDLSSNAIVERLGADLDVAAAAADVAGDPAGPSSETPRGRVPMPALVIGDRVLVGMAAREAVDELLAGVGAPALAEPPEPERAVALMGPVTTAEVAAVCELPEARVATELWRLAAEWRITVERVPGGELWTGAR